MMKQAVCPTCGAANRIAPGHAPGSAKCGKCSGALELDQALEVDDAALQRHLERTKGLVLVDVWAPWCGPCRAMAPFYAQAAGMLGAQARLLKLNVDRSETARRLGISGIPALLLFRDGRVIDRKAGLMRAEDIVHWVREHAAAPVGSTAI